MSKELDEIVLRQCIWMEKEGISFKLTDDYLQVETTYCTPEQKDKLMQFEEEKRPYVQEIMKVGKYNKLHSK